MVPRVRPAPRIESIGLVRHLVRLDAHAGGVVAVDLAPAVRAHVPRRKEVDGAVAFAEDDAVVDGGRIGGVGGGGSGVLGVDGEVDVGVHGVGAVLVEVAAFGRLADAVEAEDSEVGGEREAGLERVEPGSRDVLVRFDLLRRVRDAVGVGVLDLIRVPVLGGSEEVVESLFDGEVLRGDKG